MMWYICWSHKTKTQSLFQMIARHFCLKSCSPNYPVVACHIYIAHCKNRLVVLTTQWLQVYCGIVEANCIRQSVSLLFPHSEVRKRGQGNYLSGWFAQFASDTNTSHATMVTTLWLKQPIFFFSDANSILMCNMYICMYVCFFPQFWPWFRPYLHCICSVTTSGIYI